MVGRPPRPLCDSHIPCFPHCPYPPLAVFLPRRTKTCRALAGGGARAFPFFLKVAAASCKPWSTATSEWEEGACGLWESRDLKRPPSASLLSLARASEYPRLGAFGAAHELPDCVRARSMNGGFDRRRMWAEKGDAGATLVCCSAVSVSVFLSLDPDASLPVGVSSSILSLNKPCYISWPRHLKPRTRLFSIPLSGGKI